MLVTIYGRVELMLSSHTDQLVTTAIHAGADVVSVHGRTRHQSSSGHPVNLPAIKFAVEAAKGEVPVVANGDVFSLAEARLARKECGVNGVMSARGLLANPVWVYLLLLCFR